MGTFGLQLRRARESRGVRLVEAALGTKIAAHNLVALEYEDFDALPGDEDLVKGYLRTYAEYLGLEPEVIVAEGTGELEARRPAPAQTTEVEGAATPSEAGDERRPRIAPGILIAAAALVVALALIGWWWFGAGDSREPTTRGDRMQDHATATTEAAQEPPSEPAPAKVDPEPTEAAPVDEEPPPPPEAAPPSARLSVPEHGVGTRVVNRRLVGAGDRFPEGTRVYYWTLILGGREGNTIRHVWIHEGRVKDRVPLTVDGPHWRTQSRRTLTPGSAGHWVVEAQDDAGNVLARSEFDCVTD